MSWSRPAVCPAWRACVPLRAPPCVPPTRHRPSAAPAVVPAHAPPSVPPRSTVSPRPATAVPSRSTASCGTPHAQSGTWSEAVVTWWRSRACGGGRGSRGRGVPGAVAKHGSRGPGGGRGPRSRHRSPARPETRCSAPWPRSVAHAPYACPTEARRLGAECHVVHAGAAVWSHTRPPPRPSHRFPCATAGRPTGSPAPPRSRSGPVRHRGRRPRALTTAPGSAPDVHKSTSRPRRGGRADLFTTIARNSARLGRGA